MAGREPLPIVRRPDDRAARLDPVWYAAYGSNLDADRFGCYLGGGRPVGGQRDHPGCRDGSPPRDDRPVLLPGGLYFALESRTWSGGMAFYDPGLPGVVAARAYLLTADQFADVAAQEMHRLPSGPLDLIAAAVAAGRASTGPGRYETVVCAGILDGHPVLTLTAPWRAGDVPPNPPAPAYLATIARGLRASHGWTDAQIADYLAGANPCGVKLSGVKPPSVKLSGTEPSGGPAARGGGQDVNRGDSRRFSSPVGSDR